MRWERTNGNQQEWNEPSQEKGGKTGELGSAIPGGVTCPSVPQTGKTQVLSSSEQRLAWWILGCWQQDTKLGWFLCCSGICSLIEPDKEIKPFLARKTTAQCQWFSVTSCQTSGWKSLAWGPLGEKVRSQLTCILAVNACLVVFCPLAKDNFSHQLGLWFIGAGVEIQ